MLFYINNAFFNSDSVLLNFSVNSASDVADVLLTAHNYHRKPCLALVLLMSYLFHFHPHFHYYQ